MKVHILFYAALKDFFPESLEVNIKEKSTVSELIDFLGKQNPGAKEILSFCRAAKNEEFLSPDSILEENDELALLPPVSGG